MKKYNHLTREQRYTISVCLKEKMSLLGDAQWGEPELKNKIEVDEVELVLPTPNKRNGDTNDKVNDSRNDRANDSLYDRLNVSIRTTYTIISSNPGIQRKGISDISGKSIPTIDRHIVILIKDEMGHPDTSCETRVQRTGDSIKQKTPIIFLIISIFQRRSSFS